jgi:RNA 2',3'-cyclic 3'-phosphodiesterase
MTQDERSRPLRLFVAVPAPEPVREAAEATIAAFRAAGDVRWVAPHLLHLTLKFLGPTSPEKVQELVEVLEKNANNYSPFVLELEGAGAFPNLRKPQTIWMGIGGETGALGALAGGVDQAVHSLGFELEKRAYRGHLTIGRVKTSKRLGELSRGLQRAAEARTTPVRWPVQGYHLVLSELRPSGPEYTVLERFTLRGAD